MSYKALIPPAVALTLAMVGAAVPAVAGEADEITVERYSHAYLRGEFAYAARRGKLPAVLLGNPFAISDDAFRSALLPALRNATRGGRLGFAAAAGDPPPSSYFVVLGFDPESKVRLDGVCAAPRSLGHDRRSGEVRMLALLCRGKTPLAQIQGTIAPPRGPDDPAFIEFARRVVRGLAPRWAYRQSQPGRRGD